LRWLPPYDPAPFDLEDDVSAETEVDAGVAPDGPLLDVFGMRWMKPMELTLVSLFLNVANAVLCGSSISRPYRHLNKCG